MLHSKIMSGKTCKKIRKALSLVNEDPTSRRNYRRFKRQYQRVPSQHKSDFIKATEGLFQ